MFFFFFDFNFFNFFGLKRRADDCSFSRGKSSFYSLYLPYFFSSPHVIVRIKPPLHPSELREGWCGFFLFYFLYPHFYILKKKKKKKKPLIHAHTHKKQADTAQDTRIHAHRKCLAKQM